MYEGKDTLDVMIAIETRGAELNRGNPFKGSLKRVDQLRSRAGFWKALGADNAILSWICYGYDLKFQEEPHELQFPNARS